MKKIALCLLLLAALVAGFAQGAIPPAPDPPRLVNDLAGVLSPMQVNDMEQRLVAFNDSTSNVICVVTVEQLYGYTPAQLAYEIGDKWGVRARNNGKRNGVVILIKPRNDNGGGEVYISVGYDLEPAIPDAIAKRIIEQKMIPELKQEHYGAAVDSALAYILPLAAGEISASDLDDESGWSLGMVFFLICLIIFVIIVIRNIKKYPPGSGTYNSGSGRGYYSGPTYMGGRSGSDWGGWSGGGGFGGGFGGFGGAGGFGGGGAGGHF